MDWRITMNLFADVLYAKGMLCYEEMEALLEISTPEEAYEFSERILGGDFNVYKRGEIYTESLTQSK